MNSCANSNTGTKLRGSNSLDLREESLSSSLKPGEPDKFDKSEKKVKVSGEVAEKSTVSNDLEVSKGKLVICQKSTGNSIGDQSFSSRIQQRNCSERNRNELRMARGNSIVERSRGLSRARPFKKGQGDRDANQDSGYSATTRQKFQESLKNQDNSQTKHYDEKRINGKILS